MFSTQFFPSISMGSECRFTDGGTVSQSLKKQKYDLTGHIQTLTCTLSVKYLIIIARMYPFVTMSGVLVNILNIIVTQWTLRQLVDTRSHGAWIITRCDDFEQAISPWFYGHKLVYPLVICYSLLGYGPVSSMIYRS